MKVNTPQRRVRCASRLNNNRHSGNATQHTPLRTLNATHDAPQDQYL
jgi:hypothetical protein